MPVPDFYLVGCQKTASTWLYQCFQEHPDIFVPHTDIIDYFNINYDCGIEWYESFFADHKGEAHIGDTSQSYYRHPLVPQRIAELTPDAKIMFSFRNPIDRAFSHYWHEKKKSKIAFEFVEVLENYDLFDNWIVSGFYYEYLKRFYEYFPKERVLILIYEDLKADSAAFIRQAFEFLEVDPDFEVSILGERVNVATSAQQWSTSKKYQKIPKGIRDKIPRGFVKAVKGSVSSTSSSEKTEYELGMDAEVRERLREIFKPENDKLAQHIGRDLSTWL